MDDPRVVKRYNDFLHERCLEDNLYAKWDALHQSMIEKITPDKIIEYEKLDLILEKHMEAAELKCRKLNMGNIPWSPSYKKIHLEFDYWRMRYRYKLGVHRNVRQLQVLQNQRHITYDKNLSLREIEIKIQDCYQRRKKYPNGRESQSRIQRATSSSKRGCG